MANVMARRSAEVAILAMLAVSGCGAGSEPNARPQGSLGPERAEPIRAVSLGPGPPGGSRVAVEIGCLDQGRLVLVGETPRSVTLRLLNRRWDARGGITPACAGILMVSLSKPLGSRDVIDASTGLRVPYTGH